MAKLTVEQALKRAAAHLRRGESAEARGLYLQLLETFPANQRVRQALAALDQDGAGRPAGTDPPPELLAPLSVLFGARRFAEMAQGARQLLARFPDSYALWSGLAAASASLGESAQAIQAFTRAAELNQQDPELHYNLGLLLRGEGRTGDAVSCYRRALALRPDYPEAHNNLGTLLRQQGDVADAIAHFERAVALRPRYAEAHCNLGNAWQDQGALDRAQESYGRALALKPDYTAAEVQLLNVRRQMAAWDQDGEPLEQACARLAAQPGPSAPFTLLGLVDDPALHQRYARAYAKARFAVAPPLVMAEPKQADRPLRIGYFGADFHDHATLYLMAGLLREHDRARFTVHAYSYGRASGGAWREGAERAVTLFADVAGQASGDIVALARSHGLDLAIDLKGYTQHARPELFAQRLAPLQLSYLGYPGTMGAPFIDYLVADPVVIPPDQRSHYDESLILLPHCYQPNDSLRAIAPDAGTRADHGLPEGGLVLCCFNNPAKIGPREWAIWMRLLQRIAGSVLWLLRSNAWCEAALVRHAAGHGIAAERLIFADPVDHAGHLARQRHADLFVDTFDYNAHTTASDALWGGLPVVTRAGSQFAARVAASLLGAVGLAELITASDAEYEALILALANDPPRLAALRQRLADNRLNAPLFDTATYTRHYEQGLTQAHQRRLAGLPPADIVVSP